MPDKTEKTIKILAILTPVFVVLLYLFVMYTADFYFKIDYIYIDTQSGRLKKVTTHWFKEQVEIIETRLSKLAEKHGLLGSGIDWQIVSRIENDSGYSPYMLLHTAPQATEECLYVLETDAKLTSEQQKIVCEALLYYLGKHDRGGLDDMSLAFWDYFDVPIWGDYMEEKFGKDWIQRTDSIYIKQLEALKTEQAQ